MLQRKEFFDDGTVLGVWLITESVAELIDLLPESQRLYAEDYIATIKSEHRVLEWLATRALLLELVGEEKTIAKNSYGKPYLSDNSYNISISHTKNNLVAIILHKQCVVGIDIEVISDRVTKISDRFISEKEFVDVTQPIIHQLLHWSAKEVMFKIINENEINFKEHLFITPFSPQKKGVIMAQEFKTEKQQSFQIYYEVHSSFVLTWAVGC